MTANELRAKYFQFFQDKGHKLIPSASLIPENDPTVLFTTAGMHPLTPYLLGEKHPAGKRVVNAQKCVRTDDIEEVGDTIHHTFFEMLGNWSFGDYFKDDAIKWSWEFLTDKKWLGIDKNRLAISIFAGDDDAPLDEESKKLWLSVGVPEERIAALPKKNNWWGPAGQTGPCGPDTEMFYWSGEGAAPARFDADDVRWVEIWNDVFMQYNKKANGSFEPLKQKNVDTGMGLERTLAVLNNLDDNYRTELFWPIIQKIEELSGKKYQDYKKEMRIIADHIRAVVFLASDGVNPSHIGRGYILRRLIRRVLRLLNRLLITEEKIETLAHSVIGIYRNSYPELGVSEDKILDVLREEESRFQKTLASGLRYVHGMTDLSKISGNVISGVDAFTLFSTYGFPIEMTEEIAKERGMTVDIEGFKREMEKHQELSRTASAGMFKGGLADNSGTTTKYHTATHLLHAALRQILGKHVEQKGSNITAERLRFDFSHPAKMSPEELGKVESLVNKAIENNYPVSLQEMTVDEAKKSGAIGLFSEKYGEKVKVYTIGDPELLPGADNESLLFSREICGGPHAESTQVLGKFKIIKEEAVAAGIRRIKAVLE